MNEQHLTTGQFQMEVADEGGYQYVKFDPPLDFNFEIYQEERNGEVVEIAYVQYDFGMECEMRVDLKGNFLIRGYNGVTKDSSYTDRVKATVLYDLIHAFTHFEGDPNYTYLHWALSGWLKGRAQVIEREITDERI